MWKCLGNVNTRELSAIPEYRRGQFMWFLPYQQYNTNRGHQSACHSLSTSLLLFQPHHCHPESLVLPQPQCCSKNLWSSDSSNTHQRSGKIIYTSTHTKRYIYVTYTYTHRFTFTLHTHYIYIYTWWPTLASQVLSCHSLHTDFENNVSFWKGLWHILLHGWMWSDSFVFEKLILLETVNKHIGTRS